MAETFGSLCDKLTILKLKQFHSSDATRLASLDAQEIQLKEEIDAYLNAALSGAIPKEKLIFEANKVFKKEGNETRDFNGDAGSVISSLANINCELWHEQEKVYEFEKVPPDEKDKVVKRLAILNLERNKCIDELNRQLAQMAEKA